MVEIPKSGAGLKTKYNFSSLKIAGEPLVVALSKKEGIIEARRVRSAASIWASNNAAKLVTRLGDGEIKVYRAG